VQYGGEMPERKQNLEQKLQQHFGRTEWQVLLAADGFW